MGPLLLTVILAAQSGTPSPASAPTGSDLSIVDGQVVKVDLSRGQLTVKVAGTRELVVVVPDTIRLSRQGHGVALEDVRSGDKVLVSCASVGSGRCQARLIKVGTWKLPGPEARKAAE